MKRLIGILLVVLLLLMSFCGCNSLKTSSDIDLSDEVVTSTEMTVSYGGYPNESYDDVVTSEDDVGDLDLETIKKIKKDYLTGSNSIASLKLVKLRYYGTLSDGSMVVLMDRIGSHKIQGFTIVTEYIADEYVCVYMSNQNRKKIYKNGRFANIKQAYDEGLISKEVLDEYAEKFPDDIKKIDNE